MTELPSSTRAMLYHAKHRRMRGGAVRRRQLCDPRCLKRSPTTLRFHKRFDEQLKEVVANAARGDAEALVANGQFLEAKFRDREFLNVAPSAAAAPPSKV